MTGCEVKTQERKVVEALVPGAFRLASAADAAVTTSEACGKRPDIYEHHLVVNPTRSKDQLSRYGMKIRYVITDPKKRPAPAVG